MKYEPKSPRPSIRAGLRLGFRRRRFSMPCGSLVRFHNARVAMCISPCLRTTGFRASSDVAVQQTRLALRLAEPTNSYIWQPAETGSSIPETDSLVDFLFTAGNFVGAAIARARFPEEIT